MERGDPGLGISSSVEHTSGGPSVEGTGEADRGWTLLPLTVSFGGQSRVSRGAMEQEEPGKPEKRLRAQLCSRLWPVLYPPWAPVSPSVHGGPELTGALPAVRGTTPF